MVDKAESATASTETAEATETTGVITDARELALTIEAMLIASDRPCPAARLSELLGEPGIKVINEAVRQLNDEYEAQSRSFRIEQVAGGFAIMTLPRFGQAIRSLQRQRAATRLTPAALETLAIIAYKQPVLRADVEAIRGVACGEVIRTLMDHRLIKIAGRAEELGRPMLYGTTKQFLELFGLSSIKDLPKVEELAGGKNA